MKDYRNCSTYKDLRKTKAQKNCIAFGDEGGWFALNDFEGELESECDGCSNYRCPYNICNRDN